ncbi:MAG: hypothetical protein KC414_15070 [Romboutsia sp.]|nr:hypothetical protein [Romboutsia sp.]
MSRRFTGHSRSNNKDIDRICREIKYGETVYGIHRLVSVLPPEIMDIILDHIILPLDRYKYREYAIEYLCRIIFSISIDSRDPVLSLGWKKITGNNVKPSIKLYKMIYVIGFMNEDCNKIYREERKLPDRNLNTLGTYIDFFKHIDNYRIYNTYYRVGGFSLKKFPMYKVLNIMKALRFNQPFMIKGMNDIDLLAEACANLHLHLIFIDWLDVKIIILENYMQYLKSHPPQSAYDNKLWYSLSSIIYIFYTHYALAKNIYSCKNRINIWLDDISTFTNTKVKNIIIDTLKNEGKNDVAKRILTALK